MPSDRKRNRPLKTVPKAKFIGFTPEGNILLKIVDKKQIVLWMLQSNETRILGEIDEVEFSPNGRTLLGKSPEGWAFYDIPTLRRFPLPKTFSGKPGLIKFSPDGKTLVIRNFGKNEVEFWKVKSGKKYGEAKLSPLTFIPRFCPWGPWWSCWHGCQHGAGTGGLPSNV